MYTIIDNFGNALWFQKTQPTELHTTITMPANILKGKLVDGVWIETFIVEVPEKVKVAQFRLALIDFNIMPSYALSIINQIEDEVEREKLITLFEYSEFMERHNSTLVYMAKNKFGMTNKQLDQLFILANTK